MSSRSHNCGVDVHQSLRIDKQIEVLQRLGSKVAMDHIVQLVNLFHVHIRVLRVSGFHLALLLHRLEDVPGPLASPHSTHPLLHVDGILRRLMQDKQHFQHVCAQLVLLGTRHHVEVLLLRERDLLGREAAGGALEHLVARVSQRARLAQIALAGARGTAEGHHRGRHRPHGSSGHLRSSSRRLCALRIRMLFQSGSPAYRSCRSRHAPCRNGLGN